MFAAAEAAAAAGAAPAGRGCWTEIGGASQGGRPCAIWLEGAAHACAQCKYCNLIRPALLLLALLYMEIGKASKCVLLQIVFSTCARSCTCALPLGGF